MKPLPSKRPSLEKNPYSWFETPFRWLHWRRIQWLHQYYSDVRVDLNEFEKHTLIPLLLHRSEYMIRRFDNIKAICREPALPAQLLPQLQVLQRPPVNATQETLSRETVRFLTETERMVEESFLVPLRKILLTNRKIDDVDGLRRLLQEVHAIVDSIRAAGDDLFRYRFQSQTLVTNVITGESVIAEHQELSLIISHFKTALHDLQRTAEGTSETIGHWQKQIDAAKKPFLEFLAASTNAETSRRTIVIQVLAIFLALSFSTFFMTARDAFGLKRENQALKARLDEVRQSIRTLPDSSERR